MKYYCSTLYVSNDRWQGEDTSRMKQRQQKVNTIAGLKEACPTYTADAVDLLF